MQLNWSAVRAAAATARSCAACVRLLFGPARVLRRLCAACAFGVRAASCRCRARVGEHRDLRTASPERERWTEGEAGSEGLSHQRGAYVLSGGLPDEAR